MAELGRARAWLLDQGYRIEWRELGWSECLVWRGDERWLGRGRDEEGALAHALHKMFPSELAWSLLEQALESDVARSLDPLVSTEVPVEAAVAPPVLEPVPRAGAIASDLPPQRSDAAPSIASETADEGVGEAA